MHLIICVVVLLFSSSFAAETGSPCITPNGEKASCISINSCLPIKQAIAHLDDSSIEFARRSKCGSFEGYPLVCCGTAGIPNSANPHPPETEVEPIANVLLPDRSLCGIQFKQNRVVKEGDTEITEFPWLVALKYTKEDGSFGGFHCTGTLINHRYVLTAAQCLKIPGYKLNEVRLGEWQFTTVKPCDEELENDELNCADPVVDVTIIEKIPHPYYNENSSNNDIALLRLEKKTQYTRYIRPICLPSGEYPVPPAGALMAVSGWEFTKHGSQSMKRKTQVPMVDNGKCDTVFPNYTQRNPNKACVGGEKNSIACHLVSGAPLLRTYQWADETEDEQWYQEGIIYKSLGCDKTPGLYTMVSRYIHWILSNLKQS